MTKIVDLMKSIIGIFNEHAGEDKMLDKEELKAMMAHDVFSSQEKLEELVNELDKNHDDKISFDEFIKSMAYICALVKIDGEDAADFNGGHDPTWRGWMNPNTLR
ncbi:Oidioi.mRNA.OKI2018_I69.PAR.g8871.t1.cds [Oikopleura dioica]|uniref:Oidioi.mRNA.OKI2018_I69.PAR.g8871.t1.cds n=1 Tax=Oikopleura dioica TaxID=34765 RepID=A0ABN7RI07_OIKDI|nr:Oidioi.mRNA.OKI2018_I69.PAR.g8871.t1.cds [Oikopleura dioica]